MSVLNKKMKLTEDLKTAEKVLFGLAFVFAFLFMSHPDLWETANHSYVFLESVFSGKFLNFYDFCAAHNNTYYYINVANYNIIVYIIFGLWELPVYIFNHLFGLALNENFIIYWAKIISVGFFVGCGYMVKKLCINLNLSEKTSFWAAMFFMFNPIAFYSPMAMGQYDTLCLFFMLWALCYWAEGKTEKFSFVMGAGIVCKFFPLLVLIPLVLLSEKKILKIIKCLAISFWLYLPTTLLFMGRTGNASAFTKAMAERMFTLTVDTGFGKMSVFLVVYALIVFAAFVYCPKSERDKNYTGIYICMTVFGTLFCCIYWHPQWVILLIPFVVVTTFLCENKTVWFYMDIVMAAGFFFTAFTYFPNQTGAMLFSGGIAKGIMGSFAREQWRPISYFLNLVPYLSTLVPVMFCGSIIGNIIFKLPVCGHALSDKISDNDNYDKIPLKFYCMGIFVIGFLGLWLAPSLLEMLNAIGII